MGDESVETISPEAARERWDSNPIGLFETFRDLAVSLVEIVARVHYEAKLAEPAQPLSLLLLPVADLFASYLKSAKHIWWATPLCNCITRSEPIRVDREGNRRSQYDGSCYHEVAIKFADGLQACCKSDMGCRAYADMLRFKTARGDAVTDYIASLAADIRCECRDGMDSWHAREPAQSDAIIDPLFAEVAAKHARDLEAARLAREAHSNQRELDDAYRQAAELVAGYRCSDTPPSMADCLGWAEAISACCIAARAAGKLQGLIAIAEYLDGPDLAPGYRLAGRLFKFAVRGTTVQSIADHLMQVAAMGALRDGLECAAENVRSGGPFPRQAAEISVQAEQPASPPVGPVRANTAKLFPKGVPQNPNIVDLVARLDAAKGTGRTDISIAREYFSESEGNDPKSRSHLSQIRRMRRKGRITL